MTRSQGGLFAGIASTSSLWDFGLGNLAHVGEFSGKFSSGHDAVRRAAGVMSWQGFEVFAKLGLFPGLLFL